MRKKTDNKRRNIVVGAGLAASILGVAALPFAASLNVDAATSGTATTQINVTVNPVITITAPNIVTLGGDGKTITPTDSGVNADNDATVTVTTNNKSGYTLVLTDQDATTDMTQSGSSTPIKTMSAAAADVSADTWGWKASTAPKNGTFYHPVLKSGTAAGDDTTVRKTSAPSVGTASELNTTVSFRAKITNKITSGTYTDTVLFTATTN